MSSFLNNNLRNINVLNNLLGTYDRVMVIKIFIDTDDNILKDLYYNAVHNHNARLLNNAVHIDAGFDLFAPGNDPQNAEIYGDFLPFFGPGWHETSPVNKLDFKICCAAKMFLNSGKNYNTGYYSNLTRIEKELEKIKNVMNEAKKQCSYNIEEKTSKLLEKMNLEKTKLHMNRRVFYHRLKALDLIETSEDASETPLHP